MNASLPKENPALKHARTALRLMTERNVEPTPTNYAVWFHYAAGDHAEMNQEMNAILQKKSLAITDDLTIYFYNKYILSDVRKVEKANDSAATNTQTVLSEIMQAIDKFGGDAKAYDAQIGEQVDHLSRTITDPALKELAKEIISRAGAIRNSGAALSVKLEESRREVTALKENLEKVTMESSQDFLTGTANRKALEVKLEEMTGEAKKKGGDLCLLMLDIDHFKKFNDKFGHLVGDEVLRKVGRGMLDCVKGKDFVARYGGEEFAVLLPNTPLAGGLAVAENIRKSIAETELMLKDTGTSLGGVTVSIGVARYRPEADSIPLLISRADNALYRSKLGGRNRVTQESFEKE